MNTRLLMLLLGCFFLGTKAFTQSLLENLEKEQILLVEKIQPYGVSLSSLKKHPSDQSIRTNFSGVLLDAEGHIVTIGEALREARKIAVTLNTGEIFEAQIIGLDDLTNVGVLKIEKKGIPALPWGDSDQLKRGSFLVTLGSPYDLSQTLSTGIVSGVDRLISPDLPYMIQMTAPLNPGDPGGLVANSRGEFVGMMYSNLGQPGSHQLREYIDQLESDMEQKFGKLLQLLQNSQQIPLQEEVQKELQKEIESLLSKKTEEKRPYPFLGAQGINFFLPSNRIRYIVKELITHGHVRRSKLGVTVLPLLPSFPEPLKNGVFVKEMDKNGPAAKAGIQVNDVLILCNNILLKDIIQVRSLIQEHPPGTEVTFQVFRLESKQILSFKVILGS
jgi:S1-C subfamily serine protease